MNVKNIIQLKQNEIEAEVQKVGRKEVTNKSPFFLGWRRIVSISLLHNRACYVYYQNNTPNIYISLYIIYSLSV